LRRPHAEALVGAYQALLPGSVFSLEVASIFIDVPPAARPN
jgi:hypothetical protein